MAQRLKPVAYARQDALEAVIDGTNEALGGLHRELHQLAEDQDRAMKILELALLKVMQDVETMSSVLVDAGLLEDPDDDFEEPEAIVHDERDDGEPEEDEERAAAEEDRGIKGTPLDPALAQYGDRDPDGPSSAPDQPEGSGTAESPEQRTVRIEQVRARRRAAAREQGLVDFEQANETLEAERDGDPNQVTDVPEEGIVVGPGRDPITGEVLS